MLFPSDFFKLGKDFVAFMCFGRLFQSLIVLGENRGKGEFVAVYC